MPLLKDRYTSEDYWNLPEGERAELIDGKFYDMAPPSRIHQKLVFTISRIIGNYIADRHGSCEVYPAPFAVNLDADDKDWVEPDISVICDPNKLTDRGCSRSSGPHLRDCLSIQPQTGLRDKKRHLFSVRCPGILDCRPSQRACYCLPL